MSSRQHSSDAGHVGGEELIAIGASTGGTEAIKDILVHLPAGLPGIVIVQHMPETFTGSFAHRLDSLCAFRVKEAEHDEPIRRNTAYIAPGHSHLLVRAAGGAYHVELSREPPVNRHRPSVDVLFGSVARQARHRAIGVILTGMGKDGALGMLEMRRAGAYTIAQDERSSVVYGMPREACSVGGVVDIASLSEIPQRILARLRGDAIARS